MATESCDTDPGPTTDVSATELWAVTIASSIHEEHYTDVADNYDFLYREINDGLMKILEKRLDLQPNDKVLDLGGGTGFMAEEIHKKGRLKSPVWCVDPSAAMIKKAKEREGVLTAVSSGEEFFSARNPDVKLDKVLMSGVVHHFHDPLAVYRGVYEALDPNGFCLIILRQPQTTLPFFKAATDAFNECCESPLNLINQLKEASFDVSHYEDASELHVTKRRWYEMLRGRFFSMLNWFSDEEIEEGIQELENGYFKETGWDAPIILYDRVLVKAEKRAVSHSDSAASQRFVSAPGINPSPSDYYGKMASAH